MGMLYMGITGKNISEELITKPSQKNEPLELGAPQTINSVTRAPQPPGDRAARERSPRRLKFGLRAASLCGWGGASVPSAICLAVVEWRGLLPVEFDPGRVHTP